MIEFYLSDEQLIVFSEDDAIDNIVNRPTIAQNMFLACFDANKKYSPARELTHYKLSTKFV